MPGGHGSFAVNISILKGPCGKKKKKKKTQFIVFFALIPKI